MLEDLLEQLLKAGTKITITLETPTEDDDTEQSDGGYKVFRKPDGTFKVIHDEKLPEGYTAVCMQCGEYRKLHSTFSSAKRALRAHQQHCTANAQQRLSIEQEYPDLAKMLMQDDSSTDEH